LLWSKSYLKAMGFSAQIMSASCNCPLNLSGEDTTLRRLWEFGCAWKRGNTPSLCHCSWGNLCLASGFGMVPILGQSHFYAPTDLGISVFIQLPRYQTPTKV
jgi:hypothetical protein